MTDEHSNLGLLVTVRTLAGIQLDIRTVRFASGQSHHHSKQPMLVLFTDDGRRVTSSEDALKGKEQINNNLSVHLFKCLDVETGFSYPNSCSFSGSDDLLAGPKLPLPSLTLPSPGHRRARSLDYDEETDRKPCQRLPLYVDFEEIGWSGWIVSPRGYNAYHCKGSCPFPLGQNMRPTNHATVQSIINALKLTKGIETPCCVPDKLFSINLLYFDDDENVVLKQYDDMVAGSCGCH